MPKGTLGVFPSKSLCQRWWEVLDIGEKDCLEWGTGEMGHLHALSSSNSPLETQRWSSQREAVGYVWGRRVSGGVGPRKTGDL